MGRAYSLDLRERVVGAVLKGGLSCHQAAAQFGVGISTAIFWVQRFRRTGNVEPDQIGGYKEWKDKHEDGNSCLGFHLLSIVQPNDRPQRPG